MCGRYALALSNEEVYDALENQLPRMFARGQPRWEREQDYRPGNYNVAPRQRMPIIHRDPQDGERAMLHTAQWGLIPHWTKHPPIAPLNTINARSESLLDSGSGGMWHALKGYKRCVVPAQGYYEWQKKPSAKIAHFTRLPDDPSSSTSTDPSKSTTPRFPLLFFAGLYDTVKYASPVESRFKPSASAPSDNTSSPSDSTDKDTLTYTHNEPYPTGNPIPLSTFTILTTAPPADFAWLHDRMPCILQGWEEVEAWLDLGQEAKGWVEPAGKGEKGTGGLLRGRSGLECYPVPPEVGKVGTNSPTYIQPVSQRADGIKSFFQKQAAGASPKKGGNPKIKKEDKPSADTLTGGVKRERDADAGTSVSAKMENDAKGINAVSDTGREDGASERKRSTSSPVPVDRSETDTKVQTRKHGEIKSDEPTVIKDEEGEEDREPGLGVDSNAPLPEDSKDPPRKAKVDDENEGILEVEGDVKREAEGVSKRETGNKDETPKKKVKRGGHEIKVTRRPEEAKTDQSSITSFFASPAKDKDKDREAAKTGSGGQASGKAKPAASARKTRSSR